MEQPLTLHWLSTERFFTALLTPDLFGGWVVVTASGPRDGRGGRVRHKPVENYEKGSHAIRQLRQRRRRDGYELCEASFTELNGLDPHSPDMRAAESGALLRLFRDWDLSAGEQAALLGVDGKTLDTYLDGQPLADDPALLARAGHLLAIHKILRLRYANHRDVIQAWLRRSFAKLGNRCPLAVILESPDNLASMRRGLEQESGRYRQCPGATASENPRSEPAGAATASPAAS